MIVAAALPAMMQVSHFRPVADPTAETILYIVRPGDTLDRLSRSFLVERRTWRSLLKLAGIRDPRRLPAGRRLSVPRAWLRYSVEPARLASYRGNVRISVGGRQIVPKIGAPVSEGARLETAANSFVTLILADQSQIVLPSQSRVRVLQLHRTLLTGAVDYRIEVESGRLETKVTPLTDPSGRYRIETPVSMTAVRGTEFRVAFTPDHGSAATEVLGGKVALSSPADERRALLVESGLGATMNRTGDARTEKLLAAPELDDPGRVQTRDNVEFRARPVSGAQSYRAVIASDAGFIDNIAEQISPNGVFSVPDISNGNRFVRISAIAASGLEGLAQSYGFSRRLASINATVDQDEDGYRFRWHGQGSGARRYRFQLMANSPGTRPLVDQVGLEDDALTLRNLAAGVYYWRVGLIQIEAGETVESWTDPEKLTIAAASSRQRER